MNRTEISEKVQEIFRNIFDDDSLEITDVTTAADVEDWDSLEQINILVAMEKEFSVKFSVGEVEGLKNVGEMIDLIASKL
ncbi:MAG: acyl carrier protein [Ruminococcaceae bacterium]|jgi:acyl carrier protein|nr:acyl carrier protein [Oscillospiraceae bacterium]